MSERATAEDFAAARARLVSGDYTPTGPRPGPKPPGRPRRVQRGRIDVSSRAPRTRDRVPRGSRQPLEAQAAIRLELERGDALNAIARRHDVTRDVVKVIRDGYSRKSTRARKAVAA